MTYNFDPDTWYDNEILVLNHQLNFKKITRDQFNLDMEILEKRYEKMWDRLNGSYQVFPDKKDK
jgi:hypothetical protein